MSRRRAASAAASFGAAHSSGTSRHSASRKFERRRSELRRARRTVATSQRRTRPSSTSSRPMSLTVSPRTVRSMSSAAISVSPGRRLNGCRSRSQLRRRTPSLSSPATRAELTKIRRRWLVATNPTTRGAVPGRPGTTHDVDDLADLGPTGVEQRQAHHPERVDHLACHAARLPGPPCSERSR